MHWLQIILLTSGIFLGVGGSSPSWLGTRSLAPATVSAQALTNPFAAVRPINSGQTAAPAVSEKNTGTGTDNATAALPTVYSDDRSTPQALMQSWANAINRHEFLRVYSYWEPGAPQLTPYPQFAAGYANTASVEVVMGTVTGDQGAGQLYYSVPVTLHASTTGGTAQTFVGCYILHLAQPAIQAAPPFAPLAIRSASVQQVSNDANTAFLMAHACQIVGQPLPPAPMFNPADISALRYLDDRSDPVQVLRSLFNAVNRQEYVRAYSYWESGAGGLAPFPQFAQGYAQTRSVQLITGTVSSEAGAGQFYYKVPVTLTAQTRQGVTQTFVGCYTLHLSNPQIQGTPPFRPLGIFSAHVLQVSNTANTSVLMQQSCH